MSKNASHVMGARASNRPVFFLREISFNFVQKKKKEKRMASSVLGEIIKKNNLPASVVFLKKWPEKQSFFFSLNVKIVGILTLHE